MESFKSRSFLCIKVSLARLFLFSLHQDGEGEKPKPSPAWLLGPTFYPNHPFANQFTAALNKHRIALALHVDVKN
jgi:hypothetical protein